MTQFAESVTNTVRNGDWREEQEDLESVQLTEKTLTNIEMQGPKNNTENSDKIALEVNMKMGSEVAVSNLSEQKKCDSNNSAKLPKHKSMFDTSEMIVETVECGKCTEKFSNENELWKHRQMMHTAYKPLHEQLDESCEPEPKKLDTVA